MEREGKGDRWGEGERSWEGEGEMGHVAGGGEGLGASKPCQIERTPDFR